jgi:hypothetical protein
MTPSSTSSRPAALDEKHSGNAAETEFRGSLDITKNTKWLQLASYRAKRAGKILTLKLRSSLSMGGALSGSSAAAVLQLERLRIPARGPFVTPARGHFYVINECLLTEEELVALHQSGQFQAETIASCLINLKRAQMPCFLKQRRSQRIMLRLPLLVRAEMPDGDCLNTDASTVIVNAHGGLLETHLRMKVGQKIELASPQSGKQVACRIVSIEETSATCFAAAFEFDKRSPWFWPLSFPPVDWAATAAGLP